jgi:hypothetical protein
MVTLNVNVHVPVAGLIKPNKTPQVHLVYIMTIVKKSNSRNMDHCLVYIIVKPFTLKTGGFAVVKSQTHM